MSEKETRRSFIGRAGLAAAAGIAWPYVTATRLRAAEGAPAPSDKIHWKKIVLDRKFRSEGVATGDVNKDGKLDVLAGDVWYEAPDWKMHEIRTPGNFDGAHGYSQCFQNYAQDVNGDGWIDSIVVNFPGQKCVWYENPQGKPGPWKERLIWRSACNETPLFADLLGNGKPVPVFPFQPEGTMAWFSIPQNIDAPSWDMHAISQPKAPGTAQFSHGMGVGDVNGDGRNDVLCTAGWWEAPEDRTAPNWPFHPANLGPDCANMLVYDVNGDGLPDIIGSSAHGYGLWWFEQTKTDKGIEWRKHEIMGAPKAGETYPPGTLRPFSQLHALILADINGDGVMDLVTGKRFWAHGPGGDADPGGPAMLCWFELRRLGGGRVEWTPHVIDDDSGVGTQFEVRDMNGDGRLDVVTSNKKGVYIFLQE